MAAVLAVLSSLSPGPGAGTRARPPAPPPAAEPPWIPVHPERQARFAGKTGIQGG